MPKMEIWAGVRGAKKAVRSYPSKEYNSSPFASYSLRLDMCTADTCPLTSSVLITHSFLDCHHVIMIAINCHQASFLRSKPVQSPLRGMWGRSVAERGPTFSIKTPPRRRGAPGGILHCSGRFSPQGRCFTRCRFIGLVFL